MPKRSIPYTATSLPLYRYEGVLRDILKTLIDLRVGDIPLRNAKEGYADLLNSVYDLLNELKAPQASTAERRASALCVAARTLALIVEVIDDPELTCTELQPNIVVDLESVLIKATDWGS